MQGKGGQGKKIRGQEHKRWALEEGKATLRGQSCFSPEPVLCGLSTGGGAGNRDAESL